MATTTAALELERQKRSLLHAVTTFPVAIGFLIAAGVFVTVRGTLAEPDIFWHLRDAQYAVANLHLVGSDAYSFTAGGASRVNQEWLSGLAYYGAYRAFAWQGVLALYCGLLMAMVVGVYRLAVAKGPTH